MILIFWPHPKVTSLTLGWKFYLHSVCASSLSIWYATWPCLKKNIFWPPGHPSAPKSHPWCMNQATEWKSGLICFNCIFHLWEHTKFGIKIFEIDFVIEIKWYLTFWSLPRAPGGRATKGFAVAHPIHVSNSHMQIWLNFVQWFRRR